VKGRQPVLCVGQTWLSVRVRRYFYIVGFTLDSVRVAYMQRKEPRYIQINVFFERARSGAYRRVR
jgi:hypothetical protein